jgi:hypothetical protein
MLIEQYENLTEDDLAELKRREEEVQKQIEFQLNEIGKLDTQWLNQHRFLLEKKREINKAFRQRELNLKRLETEKLNDLDKRRQKLANLKPTTLHQEKLSISARLKALNCDPVEILAAIAMGDNVKLNSSENVRIFERRMAAQELLSYVAPKLAAKRVEDDTEVETIPVFIPKRGDLVPQPLLELDREEREAKDNE